MLTKDRVIRLVTICYDPPHVNVQHVDRVLEDGEVISIIPHRRVYKLDEYESLVADVSHGAAAAAALGWTKEKALAAREALLRDPARNPPKQ
jgi:hypothetical protein